MQQVKLTQGKVALVDDEDFERINQHKWYAQKREHTFYAVRKLSRENGKQERVYMHREVMSVPKGVEIDHRFGDGLDNRKENLRRASRQQNACNQGLRKDNTSGLKGVSRFRSRWRADIRHGNKKIYLGLFATDAEASQAYATASQKFFGAFQRTT